VRTSELAHALDDVAAASSHIHCEASGENRIVSYSSLERSVSLGEWSYGKP
jgi:hypothetical protein